MSDFDTMLKKTYGPIVEIAGNQYSLPSAFKAVDPVAYDAQSERWQSAHDISNFRQALNNHYCLWVTFAGMRRSTADILEVMHPNIFGLMYRHWYKTEEITSLYES